MSGVQILFYFGLAVCLVGVVYKIIRLATLPMHLRWDLYPIPHEKTRHTHGGSYYEVSDFLDRRRTRTSGVWWSNS